MKTLHLSRWRSNKFHKSYRREDKNQGASVAQEGVRTSAYRHPWLGRDPWQGVGAVYSKTIVSETKEQIPQTKSLGAKDHSG